MLYPIIENKKTTEDRERINAQILMSVLKGKKDFSNTEIYNNYTGIGGLHGLERNEFDSFHAYTEAKKEIEQGQFFTPHKICQQMVDMVSPDVNETVLDMCCGIGNFFNHLPNQFNVYGYDIDENAVKIAKRLYPDANIEVNDLRYYDPIVNFDIIVGNPPFNLDFDGIKSQVVFLHKAYWMLNPAGIMVLVMPMSYLANESADRTYISMTDRDFSFIGQTQLDSNAFSSLGVQNFGTKIMAFMRKTDAFEHKPYQADEFISSEDLKDRITQLKTEKQRQKLKLLRERNMYAQGSIESRLANYKASKEDTEKRGKATKVTQKDTQLNLMFTNMSCHIGIKYFEDTLQKYLYELKTHKHLNPYYHKAEALVAKFRNQKPPFDCTREQRVHWEIHIKISPQKVLAILRNIIRKQYVKHRKEHKLVQTQYGYKLKNLNSNPFTNRNTDKYVPFYDLIANGIELPQPSKMTAKLQKQYRHAEKILTKKRRAFKLQNTPWKDMERDAELDKYIDGLTFVGMKQTECKFSDLQKQDMGLLFQKQFSLLNWQQGSGKTAVLYHYGKYQLRRKLVKNVVIVAPSIAVDMTWAWFLKYNHEDFVLASKIEHLDNIPEGKIVILSVSMIGKIEQAIKQFMKKRSNKICLLFDESDELTNDQAKRTKLTLSCFRRAKSKMLGTGTTTRNYVSELYSQMELMYNNSVNLICDCPYVYYEDDKRDIKQKDNPYYRKPFPPRRGASLFKACFNPFKSSVFGIEKHNQDIYNKDALWALIGKTIVTRKFHEFAGDKYTIHSHSVVPASGELGVFKKVIDEFHDIVDLYFNKVDSRKENSLKIIRQIQLLIKSCSVPSLMEGYNSDSEPQKVIHIEDMVRCRNEKVAIGCTSLETLDYYADRLKKIFPDRPLFIAKGEITVNRRSKIIKQFEASENGIMLCTQQSLKSSVNIPECNEVILESQQWNIPKMEQFYFRFIRFDSLGHTNVHFVSYLNSIEQNIMALLLTKERLNDFIQFGEVTEELEIFDEFGVSTSILGTLFTREKDEDGKFVINWGQQQISA